MTSHLQDLETEHDILMSLRMAEIDARRQEAVRLRAVRDRAVARRRRELARRRQELERGARGELRPEEQVERQARIAAEDARFARAEERWRRAHAALRARTEAEDALWRETRIRVIGAALSPAYTSTLPS